MKLGISTACFYPLPIEQALDEIGKLGLRTAEIFSTRKVNTSNR